MDSRMSTIEKINRSIGECSTAAQVESTERFLELYYRLFPFESKYLKYEYALDSLIRKQKEYLNMPTNLDNFEGNFGSEEPSIQRLQAYLETLSHHEIKAEWAQIQVQLEGIDLNNYPTLLEKLSGLRINTRTGLFQKVA